MLALVMCTAVGAPAGASPGLNARAQGSFAGGLALSFGFPCTGIGHEQSISNVDLRGPRDGVLAFDICVDYSFVVTTGTFTYFTPSGTLSGSVRGSQATVAPAVVDLDLTLDVARGTGTFAFARGDLHVSARWTAPSTITGTIEPSLRFGAFAARQTALR
jgi:hypothetical protein